MSAFYNYSTALAAMPPNLFIENMAGALRVSGAALPVDLEGETPATMASFLRDVAGRLHDLDGDLPRLPALSLYYRLFAGTDGRPPPPNNAKASREFMEAAARMLLRDSEGGSGVGMNALLAASIAILPGCSEAVESGLGIAGLIVAALGLGQLLRLSLLERAGRKKDS